MSNKQLPKGQTIQASKSVQKRLAAQQGGHLDKLDTKEQAPRTLEEVKEDYRHGKLNGYSDLGLMREAYRAAKASAAQELAEKKASIDKLVEEMTEVIRENRGLKHRAEIKGQAINVICAENVALRSQVEELNEKILQITALKKCAEREEQGLLKERWAYIFKVQPQFDEYKKQIEELKGKLETVEGDYQNLIYMLGLKSLVVTIPDFSLLESKKERALVRRDRNEEKLSTTFRFFIKDKKAYEQDKNDSKFKDDYKK